MGMLDFDGATNVIIGVTAGAGFIAIATQMVRLWTRHAGPPVAHR